MTGEAATSPQTVLLQRGEQDSRRWSGGWRCARTDGDDALLVSFLGNPVGLPSGREPLYVASARAVDEVLLVSVAPSPALVPLLRSKRSVGRVGVLRVTIDGDWRGREILDASTGRRRPVFDGDALLRPAAPAFSAGTREYGDERPSWWRWCPTGPGTGVLLTHAGDSVRFAGQRSCSVVVRGRTGVAVEERDGRRLETRVLSWSERGATVSVHSAAVGGPETTGERGLLSVDELVSFAGALV